MPVAFVKQPGDVALENSCDQPVAFVGGTTTIAKGDSASCEVTVTNYSPAAANVQVKVRGPHTQSLADQELSDGNKRNNGFIWNGTLSPALAPEAISLDSPGDGYYGGVCDDYGPLAAFTDESFANEAVVPFSFGHEMYDTLMFDSNGYLVVGGGSAADHSYSPTDLFPGPAAPNNVLAPYFTDLNPSEAGAICAGYYASGPDLYLGVEYNGVPVFGSSEPRSFEVWILSGTTDEYITFEYDETALGAGDVDATLEVGAENRDGSSAVTLGTDVVPSSDGYQVVMGSPTAGGSKTITYDAFGKKTGTFIVAASMTSDVTQGTDFQRVKIKVVNP